MAFVLWPETDGGPVIEPWPSTLGLFLRDLEPFAALELVAGSLCSGV